MAEADERCIFSAVDPYVAIVTNVEDDHLEFYRSMGGLKMPSAGSSASQNGGFAILYHDAPFACLKDDFRHLIYYGSTPDACYHIPT